MTGMRSSLKKIIYTQRVEVIENYNERRDCADQKIAEFINVCGYLPIAVNNIFGDVHRFAEEIKPDGIILTGGNDLVKYGGNAPERDETEKRLVEYGLENDIPIYGFCRGMQFLADYFGLELTKVTGHVKVQHKVTGHRFFAERIVNSFHNFAVAADNGVFKAVAWSEDGVIEAMNHVNKQIYAVMWHPERERPFLEEDIDFMHRIFGKL